ncbi:DnaB-like helicase C-terminal domain-containing protein, partial [Azohydromonas aeria]|uniref:DnaB-like helicase C-terminal domain-containing protein n=1 Tax=Azohydromonas aeria TaxID=2590212 RepID=UPI0012FC4746
MPADTDRTQRLMAELQRLFPVPSADTDAGAAAVAALQRQLAGLEPAALDLTGATGRARLMVLRFGGVARGAGAAQGAAVLQLARVLMETLDWPEAALSVDGRDAFNLWLPLAEAAPVADLREFLRLLHAVHLPEQPALEASPGDAGHAAESVILPPGLHPDTGLWSVFIAPGLASSFSEEAGIDIPPNLDKQAELLARLEPASLDVFSQALERLRRQAAPAPAPAADVAPVPGTVTPAAAPAPAPALAASVPEVLAAQREELLRALSWPVAAVSTPFAGLTSLLHGGFRGGRFYALLAPPKSGKTTLAALALEHAAARGHAALYMGFETAREQLIHAALARRLRLDAARIEARSLAPDEAARVAAALEGWLEHEGRHLALWEAAPGTALAEAAAWGRRA